VEGLCAGETIGSQDPQGTGDTGFDGLNHCCCGAVGVLCEGVGCCVQKESSPHHGHITCSFLLHGVSCVGVFTNTFFTKFSFFLHDFRWKEVPKAL
jgi:hypothetical protein